MSLSTIDGPRLEPASGGPAKQLVVLCHGYGANGQDLIGLGEHWRALLPDAAFVSPDAPEEVPGMPGGRQWFPIVRAGALDMELIVAGVRSAAPILNAFIDEELARHELTASDLALVGFSQGTMMALHVGLRRTAAPAAILGYSGLVADANPEEIVSMPPIQLIHGDQDPIIPVDAMRQTASLLSQAGLSVRWHVSQGVPHGIGPDGLEIGGAFLASSFA